MQVPYDFFIGAFLNKITEYTILGMDNEQRSAVVSTYMRRALSDFCAVCKDLLVTYDDENMQISLTCTRTDVKIDRDAIADIVSEGMVIQWLKPYVYRQENLENVLNTKDYSTYSPGGLLRQISSAYDKAQRDYTQMVREYSFRNGDIAGLHI